jgi:hypothetical protein
MSTITAASNISAPTQFLQVKNDVYAYRRFGGGPGRPLLCLQHFMGTLENWDPAVTDPLAAGREVILFRTRLPLPISRLVYPPRGGISRIGRTVRALLSRRDVTASAWNATTPIRPWLRA